MLRVFLLPQRKFPDAVSVEDIPFRHEERLALKVENLTAIGATLFHSFIHSFIE